MTVMRKPPGSLCGPAGNPAGGLDLMSIEGSTQKGSTTSSVVQRVRLLLSERTLQDAGIAIRVASRSCPSFLGLLRGLGHLFGLHLGYNRGRMDAHGGEG